MTTLDLKRISVGQSVRYVSPAGTVHGEVTERNRGQVTITWAGGKGGTWTLNVRSRSFLQKQRLEMIHLS